MREGWREVGEEEEETEGGEEVGVEECSGLVLVVLVDLVGFACLAGLEDEGAVDVGLVLMTLRGLDLGLAAADAVVVEGDERDGVLGRVALMPVLSTITGNGWQKGREPLEGKESLSAEHSGCGGLY